MNAIMTDQKLSHEKIWILTLEMGDGSTLSAFTFTMSNVFDIFKNLNSSS